VNPDASERQATHASHASHNVTHITSYRDFSLGSVASRLTATLYQGSPDKNHKLWNIVSLRDIYSIYRRFWNVATYNWKAHNGKIEIISLNITVATMTRLTALEYLSRMTMDMFHLS
jgi:hypothetical protein